MKELRYTFKYYMLVFPAIFAFVGLNQLLGSVIMLEEENMDLFVLFLFLGLTFLVTAFGITHKLLGLELKRRMLLKSGVSYTGTIIDVKYDVAVRYKSNINISYHPVIVTARFEDEHGKTETIKSKRLYYRVDCDQSKFSARVLADPKKAGNFYLQVFYSDR